MSYTDYGLTEGIIITLFSMGMTTIIAMLAFLSAKNRKSVVFIYILIISCTIIDTIWWGFDIQTNVIDYLVKIGDKTEQVTVFGMIGNVGTLVLVGISLFSGSKKKNNSSNSKQ